MVEAGAISYIRCCPRPASSDGSVKGETPNHNRGGKLEDIIFRIAIGVKNDGLSQEAGVDTLAAILQDRIENAVLDLGWVTDLLTEMEVS